VVAVVVFIVVVITLIAMKLSAPPNKPQHTENSSTPNQSHKESKNDDIYKTLWQRTMQDPIAIFTFVLACFTGLLVIVSAIQIVFLIKANHTTEESATAATDAVNVAKDTFNFQKKSVEETLLEMKAQSKAMQLATKTAQDTANIAEKNLQVARDTFNAANRPYVGVIGSHDYPAITSGEKTLAIEVTVEYDGPSGHYKESNKQQYSPDVNAFLNLGPIFTN
jgi:hypothetical protein